MATYTVTSFYYEQGSVDFPENFSPSAPFGFTPPVGGGIPSPIFGYSINDVENSLTSPRIFTNPSFDETTPARTDTLIVEAAGVGPAYVFDETTPHFVFALPNMDPGWNDVYRICEYIYRNQASANNASTGYSSIGDQVLSTDVNLTRYNHHSLAIINEPSDNASKAGRIANFSFSVNMNGGDTITLLVYLDADSFINRNGVVNYQVWCLQFAKQNPTTFKWGPPEVGGVTLTDDDIRQYVVGQVFNFMSTGRFTKMVTHTIVGSDNKSYVFYIFYTGTNDLSSDTIEIYIKNYLTGSSGVMPILVEATALFPSLYSTLVVSIYPIYSNTVNTSTNAYADVHAIDWYSLYNMIPVLGYNPSAMSPAPPIEIFHLGEDTFLKPLIAIESSLTSPYKRPITDRFRSYRPLDGQGTGNNLSTYIANNDPAVLFHFILGIAVGVAITNSLFAGVSPILKDSATYNMHVVAGTSNTRGYIAFNFNGSTFNVYMSSTG